MVGTEELARVLHLISWWIDTIKAHNAIGFFDINKVAEGVALKLLNEIYDFQLENLNYEKKNYPGVDLGDRMAKIAFQITSRKDSRKIWDSLEKFANEPIEIYSNGIQFLILSQEKKPLLKKDRCQKLLPNFEPEKHILNAADLIKEINRIYDSSKEKFYRIKEILEVEIAGKAMKQENLRLRRSILLEGSQEYYDALRGPNGRFKHLDISEIILSHPKNAWINQQVIIEGIGKRPKNVMEALPILWKKDCKHSIILGEGGMGKTVSMVRLWEDYLKTQNEKTPVPIFIALNEYNQFSDPSKREDFIISMIRRNYGNDEVTNEAIWEIIKNPLQKDEHFVPSIILMLDGFNEVTLDKRELLIELRRLIEQACGIQIVITGRYDMRINFNWTDFNLLKLMELEDEKVILYLNKQGFLTKNIHKDEQDKGILRLIKNPMMLTLYASTCEIQRKYIDRKDCEFKKYVETPGELLWNFLEVQVSQLPYRLGNISIKQSFYKLLLKFLLPTLGYEMEKKGRFELSIDEIDNIIANCLRRYCQEDFIRTFREYRKHMSKWSFSSYGHIKMLEEVEKIIHILSEEISLLVQEGNSYRFLHQNFRDFFAAVHVINELIIGIKEKNVPSLLIERRLPLLIMKFIAESTGIHRLRPFFVDTVGWKFELNEDLCLYQALDLCRGRFGNGMEIAVWNIIEIWKNFRGELTGMDLSFLDLSTVVFNEVICSRFYKDKYLHANFDRSLIHEENIFPPRHECPIYSAVFRPDGERILTTSEDGQLLEWDLATGLCTLDLPFISEANISCANYSADGNKIIYGYEEGEIDEWDSNEECIIGEFDGHENSAHTLSFSIDGKKILSASNDDSVKIWDVSTGACIKTINNYYSEAGVIEFCPDGTKFLHLGSSEIVEIEILSEKCLHKYTDESGILHVRYSPCGKNKLILYKEGKLEIRCNRTDKCLAIIQDSIDIQSASFGNDGRCIFGITNDYIKKWDIETGQCTNILHGSFNSQWTIFSPCCKKVLTLDTEYGIVQEVNLETGEYSTPFRVISLNTNIAASFSPVGDKIVTTSDDGTFREWDAVTGKCLKVFFAGTEAIYSVVYNKDSSKILTMSNYGFLKEWKADSGECLVTIESIGGIVAARYIDDCQKALLFHNFAGFINVFDLRTGKVIEISEINPSSDVHNPVIMYKEKSLRICRNCVEIVNSKTKTAIKTLFNLTGVYVQECTFRNLHPQSNWRDETKELLVQYGAVMDE